MSTFRISINCGFASTQSVSIFEWNTLNEGQGITLSTLQLDFSPYNIIIYGLVNCSLIGRGTIINIISRSCCCLADLSLKERERAIPLLTYKHLNEPSHYWPSQYPLFYIAKLTWIGYHAYPGRTWIIETAVQNWKMNTEIDKVSWKIVRKVYCIFNCEKLVAAVL